MTESPRCCCEPWMSFSMKLPAEAILPALKRGIVTLNASAGAKNPDQTMSSGPTNRASATLAGDKRPEALTASKTAWDSNMTSMVISYGPAFLDRRTREMSERVSGGRDEALSWLALADVEVSLPLGVEGIGSDTLYRFFKSC